MSELKDRDDTKNLAVVMHRADTLGHEVWGLLDKGRQHAYERMALAIAGDLPLQRVWDLSAQLEQVTKERDELKVMLSEFIPANDYEVQDEDGEWVNVNYGGTFQYNEGSERTGLEVVELLAKLNQ
jgi:hypothetical protein